MLIIFIFRCGALSHSLLSQHSKHPCQKAVYECFILVLISHEEETVGFARKNSVALISLAILCHPHLQSSSHCVLRRSE